jgi:hypothetical protein
MPRTVRERFDEKWVEDSGCWRWIGSRNWKGYGQLRVNYRLEPAHRVAYRLYVGSFDETLTIHHICENPPCVNPEHLKPMTVGDNIRASVKFGPRRRNCPNGHKYEGESFYVNPRGHRTCRACLKANNFRNR